MMAQIRTTVQSRCVADSGELFARRWCGDMVRVSVRGGGVACRGGVGSVGFVAVAIDCALENFGTTSAIMLNTAVA